MSNPIHYTASWGTPLKLITAVGSLVVLGATALCLFAPLNGPPWLHLFAALPLAILVACMMQMVRGYRLSSGTLEVIRLWWTTRVELRGLTTAALDPRACKGSLRVWGNGGFFVFSGQFSNATLGSYELFATDLSRAVVLRLPQRTVVVTPDQPEQFIRDVLQLRSA